MKILRWTLPILIALVAGVVAWAITVEKTNIGAVAEKVIKLDRGLPQAERDCIECHQKYSPSIVLDWKNSMHGRSNVTCGDCHRAEQKELDAFQCSGLKGTKIFITAVPTPKDCSKCHPVEAEQFSKSAHALGYKSVKKQESMSVAWEGKGSRAPEVTGCIQCHGSEMKFQNGKPFGLDYPQEGVGRLNIDGSVGNCVACHTRHKFNIVESRKSQTCGSCHLGPDHPQFEIWEESKHGKRYASEGDRWVWDSAPDAWEPGDYSAPTCAVCHMSGIGDLKTTHNISERISWDNKGQVSIHKDNWEAKRKEMTSVCLNCHSPYWISGFYAQYDSAVNTYNEKYAAPAKAMMEELAAAGLITKDNPWDAEIKFIFYKLWHHEGRRARMGSAMMGQDYAHWHGFFEVAEHFEALKREHARLMAQKH